MCAWTLEQTLIGLIVGVALGFLFASLIYEGEIRRQGRIFEDKTSLGSIHMGAMLASRGWRRFARIVNAHLALMQQQLSASLAEQRSFRRGLSALGHDMRTPLTGVKGYVQLARRTVDDPGIQARLDAAVERIDAAEGMLDRLQVYARANDPDRSYIYEQVGVLTLLIEVLDDHEIEFRQRGWEPRVSFENEALRVVADREALRRVLDNLVVNALRHGVSPPSLFQQDDANQWSLSITNDLKEGEAVDMTHLFDRFWKADASRRASGMGLGLSIAHSLARDMGMSLRATTGDGAISFILSPLCRDKSNTC